VGGRSRRGGSRQVFEFLKGSAFDGMVRAHVRLGKTSEAYAYLEQGRARSLLDLLERSRPDLPRRPRHGQRNDRRTEVLRRSRRRFFNQRRSRPGRPRPIPKPAASVQEWGQPFSLWDGPGRSQRYRKSSEPVRGCWPIR